MKTCMTDHVIGCLIVAGEVLSPVPSMPSLYV